MRGSYNKEQGTVTSANMVDDDTSSNGPDEQSERDRWETAHALTSGMEVTLNNEYTDLTVSHIRPNADGGDVKEITLIDENHTTYVIRVTNEDASIPLLTLPTNSQIPITSITPTEKGILARTTARDLYGSRVTDVNADPQDTYPEDRNPTPNLDSTTLNIIGECPQCDCLVAQHDEKAICTGCGTWSPIDQWNAYYEHDHPIEDGAAPGDENGRTQASLTDTWNDNETEEMSTTQSTSSSSSSE